MYLFIACLLELIVLDMWIVFQNVHTFAMRANVNTYSTRPLTCLFLSLCFSIRYLTLSLTPSLKAFEVLYIKLGQISILLKSITKPFVFFVPCLSTINLLWTFVFEIIHFMISVPMLLKLLKNLVRYHLTLLC